jgi:hypothetical protein
MEFLFAHGDSASAEPAAMRGSFVILERTSL